MKKVVATVLFSVFALAIAACSGPSLEDVCKDSCAIQEKCMGDLYPATCVEDCKTGGADYSDDCLDASDSYNSCAKDIACESLLTSCTSELADVVSKCGINM